VPHRQGARLSGEGNKYVTLEIISKNSNGNMSKNLILVGLREKGE
jgi:hypothetical protein